MALTKEEKKLRRRLKRRAGNVLFIEAMPEGLKEWLAERGVKSGRSMNREAVAILEEKRARCGG